ncbi:GIY-YIG nuclease family protein [Qipengyuania sp. MTN3-11]|uniref:GIY-YIG nuclease family protein n=1 Tax=Qipengyuania sp. MTN3-11 TaxID=3056557 RepID=UPI0036F3AEDD
MLDKDRTAEECLKELISLTERDGWDLSDYVNRIPDEPQAAYEKGLRVGFRQAIERMLGDRTATGEEKFVYFIQAHEGPIKIGIAVDVERRRKALQTGFPSELFIRATTTGGAEQEASYHRMFAAHRRVGEWFSPHPDILAEIERLNTTQDPS